jgi:hypothetical protein
LFSVESFFPHLDLAELTNLPKVFEHYRIHREITPETTFLTFLSLHYGNSGHWDIDPVEHSRLPFSKRYHRLCSPQISEKAIAIAPFRTFQFLRTIDGVDYFESSGHFVSQSVWQPPRA